MVEGLKPSLSPLTGNSTLWIPLPSCTKAKAKNRAHIPRRVLDVELLEEIVIAVFV